jgi:hypothetical protein
VIEFCQSVLPVFGFQHFIPGRLQGETHHLPDGCRIIYGQNCSLDRIPFYLAQKNSTLSSWPPNAAGDAPGSGGCYGIPGVSIYRKAINKSGSVARWRRD